MATPNQAMAAGVCRGVSQGTGETIGENSDNHVISIDMTSYDPGKEYQIIVRAIELNWFTVLATGVVTLDVEAKTGYFRIDQNREYNNGDGTLRVNNKIVTWTITRNEALKNSILQSVDTHFVEMWSGPTTRECDVGTYDTSTNNLGEGCKLYVYQERHGLSDDGSATQCYSGGGGCMQTNTDTFVRVENLKYADGSAYQGQIWFDIASGGIGTPNTLHLVFNGSAETSFSVEEEERYDIKVRASLGGTNWEFPGCSTYFESQTSCGEFCQENKLSSNGGEGVVNFEVCNQATDEDWEECAGCITGESNDGSPGMWTAIGCIPIEPTGIIQTIVTLSLSIGGGIVLLLILTGAFRLSVSAGDPKQAEEAREQITSAVIGLIFVIFAIVMLRFIGVELLQIPGFGV